MAHLQLRALGVVLLAILVALSFRASAPSAIERDARIQALAMPSVAVSGERTAVFGAAVASGQPQRPHRLVACEGDACAGAGWGTMVASNRWHGIAGYLQPLDTGVLDVYWIVMEGVGLDGSLASVAVSQPTRSVPGEGVHGAPR